MAVVLVVLRVELQQARARGLDFDHAWPAARRIALTRAGNHVEAANWAAALGATSADWASAYVGEPPRPAADAARRLEHL